MQDPEAKTEIFFSYAHEDEKLRNELEKRLGNLKREGLIAGWHDRKIGPGKEWEHEIDIHLNTAHIILLLVSPDFMVSDYCNSVEVKRAMERYKNGEALVIPIILRPVDWENALFGKLQALPSGAKPVTSQKRDKAFLDIAGGIRKAIAELTTKPIADLSLFTGTTVSPSTDFKSDTNHDVDILNGLADITIRLGGQTVDSQYRWRFCCILVPNDPHLPSQQHSLVVRAKTKLAPSAYKVGTTIVSPDEATISLTLRAYQSGRVIYRHRVTAKDASIAHRELEEPIGSAIAVPVGGEDGLPVAVLYIVSAHTDAFSEGDQRLLRMIGRMIEELLKTYQVRLQVAEKLTNLMTNPGVVDPAFAVFASENDFITDVEDLLSTMKMLAEGRARVRKEDFTDPEALKKVEQSPDAVSFIAIDIDNQTSFTNKYGYQMTKNLSRAVGVKIQRQLSVLFTKLSDCKLYHIYADRFFLMLKGVSLARARESAALLKQALNGMYQVDALRSSTELPRLTESALVLAEITVRLAIESYQYTKLEEILQLYPVEEALTSTTALITNLLDQMLKAGQDEGGNVIFSWDYKMWGWRPLFSV